MQGQRTYGNRWTLIASLLPGRCNNDIKNYFNLYLKHQASQGATHTTCNTCIDCKRQAAHMKEPRHPPTA